MSVVRRIARTIRHRKNDSRSDRAGELDGFFDLLVSCPELLRTCEVRNSSRFAMQGEHQGQMHQFFGLGVQYTAGMRLLEVIGVCLTRVKVPASNVRHVPPHQIERPPHCLELGKSGDDSENDGGVRWEEVWALRGWYSHDRE